MPIIWMIGSCPSAPVGATRPNVWPVVALIYLRIEATYLLTASASGPPALVSSAVIGLIRSSTTLLTVAGSLVDPPKHRYLPAGRPSSMEGWLFLRLLAIVPM